MPHGSGRGGSRDHAWWAVLQDPGNPTAHDRREVQARASGDVVAGSTEKQRESGGGRDAQNCRGDQASAAEAHRRESVASRRGSGLFDLWRLDGGMDGGRTLTPEVVWRERGEVGLGWGRRRLAERDEGLARPEPIAREADDLVRRLLRTAHLDVST